MENKKIDARNRLLDAVGEILAKEGHKGLGITNICKKAGVDKSLVYSIFGSLENLIETYIVGNDFWADKAKKVHDVLPIDQTVGLKDLIQFFLEKQFTNVLQDQTLQKTMLWSISESNPLMQRIVSAREGVGEGLFKDSEKFFGEKNEYFRAFSAVNVAALYYLALHASAGNGTFCGIDLNTKEGKESILQAIAEINTYFFEKYGKK